MKSKKKVDKWVAIGADPRVDDFFKHIEPWHDVLAKLRSILLDCGLTETWKWDKPCYAFQGHNVVVLLPLKKYCALLFLKGGLLHDTDGILVKAGENSQAGRQIRFRNAREISKSEPILKTYLYQAMEIEKAGLKIMAKTISELHIPEELQQKLDDDPRFKKAFNDLTPGRQRGYIFYFSQPKQSKTRTSRIEKYKPQIMEGKGMQDDYLASIRSR